MAVIDGEFCPRRVRDKQTKRFSRNELNLLRCLASMR